MSNVHRLNDLKRARKVIKEIPEIIKTLDECKSKLNKHQYYLHVELLIESIEYAAMELGYYYMENERILKTRGKIE